MIIAIEGIDGAGKNTLVSALVQDFSAHVMSFPRYDQSIHAQLARQALYGNMGDMSDSAYAMATLFALDRREAKADIDAFVGSESILLLDRYVASNAAYTAARLADENAIEWVAHLEFEQFGLARPDLQILLNTPPELAQQRAQMREKNDATRQRDLYESDNSLQNNTALIYGQLAQKQWQSQWLIAEPDYNVEDMIKSVRQRLA
ncbi:dTMP kinase [Corynebacterium sp. sy017]|uniref:dTMP kinase n=1 Tax=unclassified Corynebacterium TaxID=2624378 RepID=UPI001184E84B|nr:MULTISPECIES: dTMP kinase [unclassified Corynebacterium]MBP3088732.1 dTMP kinase [Corynebacterium sp. sy017]TSD92015.1 dTMP kinase [Corynebacterium sp. SY003]